MLTTSTLQEASHVEINGTMVAIFKGRDDTQISGPQIPCWFEFGEPRLKLCIVCNVHGANFMSTN